RVMWHRKRLDYHIPNLKITARQKKPPILRHLSVAAQRFGRQSIAIDRRGKLFAPHFEPARVVAVLVCEKNAVDLQRIQPAQAQPFDELPRAESAIDEKARLRRFHERSVTRAAAAEDREVNHFPHFLSLTAPPSNRIQPDRRIR